MIPPNHDSSIMTASYRDVTSVLRRQVQEVLPGRPRLSGIRGPCPAIVRVVLGSSFGHGDDRCFQALRSTQSEPFGGARGAAQDVHEGGTVRFGNFDSVVGDGRRQPFDRGQAVSDQLPIVAHDEAVVDGSIR